MKYWKFLSSDVRIDELWDGSLPLLNLVCRFIKFILYYINMCVCMCVCVIFYFYFYLWFGENVKDMCVFYFDVMSDWWMWGEEKMKEKTGADINLLLSKNTQGDARFNVPIRRNNRFQEYICTAKEFGIYLNIFWSRN